MPTGRNLSSAKITALPEILDRQLFVDAMLGRQFLMLHELRSRETFLICDSETSIETLRGAVPGIEVKDAFPETEVCGETYCIIVAAPQGKGSVMDGIYGLFSGIDARVIVSFVPASIGEVMSAKLKTERALSDKETGFTESLSTRSDALSQTASSHRDAYFEAEEKDMLMGLLESLKSAALANGNAYKLAVFLSGDCGLVRDYLYSKLPVLETIKVKASGIEGIYSAAGRVRAVPFDSFGASKMLGFSNAIRTNSILGMRIPESEGEVAIGQLMEGSVKEAGSFARTDGSAFNLGTLISGMPGTGKTFAAMHIAGQLAKGKRTSVVVISPTDEWNGFGYENGFRVVSLQRSDLSFNFFKCESGANVQRFYENLAMLLASASEAGPYTGSLEKCMLAAFRRVYAKERDPNPIEVYDEIEEAIIEQHGKRSGAGVKYTKHGENSRAALENLRSMLNRPEFSKRKGVDFAVLLGQGVVFDLTAVSNKMKQFYYALILNQVYSVADQLDTEGDRELRLLVCLEEAQTVFSGERESAATKDLEQRIQDFRKRGVGLMLITHSATDIEPSIRRLCQTKLYFRQSADVSKFAAGDLLFGEAEKDMLVERLKGLEQRVCAANYLQGRERTVATFLKLPEREMPEQEHADSAAGGEQDALEDARISIVDKDGAKKQGMRLQLFYVGEKFYEGTTDSEGMATIEGTIKGNAYELVVLGEKKKDSRKFKIIGGEFNIVTI